MNATLSFYSFFLFLPKVNQETSSDTEKISQSFSEMNGTKIPMILSRIQGPYAFIYLDMQNHHLYFGRDRLGRHSLLWSSDGQGGLVLTSVGKRNVLNFKEIPAIGIFRINMNSGELLMTCAFILCRLGTAHELESLL
jgi:asparagine synthetase B (glutamine-hydrolysing)